MEVKEFLSDDKLAQEVYILRYKVFVEKLKWVEGKDGLEKDQFDEYSEILGVYRKRRLVGTVRFTKHPFMLETVFRSLIGSEEIRQSNSIEISRLAIDPDLSQWLRMRAAQTLYHAVYKWAIRNKVRYLYFVTTDKLLGSLRARYGIPLKPFEKKLETADNVPYRAGVLDLKDINAFKIQISMLARFFSLKWI